MEKYDIVKFVDNDFELDVRTDKVNDTVWLNTEEISLLFGRDYKTIRKHINNALKEELDEKVVVAKFANTTKHGAIESKTQTHEVDYYNLDIIIYFYFTFSLKFSQIELVSKWNKLNHPILFNINSKKVDSFQYKSTILALSYLYNEKRLDAALYQTYLFYNGSIRNN